MTTVVEIATTVGLGITPWRDTLNSKIIETEQHNTWGPFCRCGFQKIYTRHVWIERSGIQHVSFWNIHVRINLNEHTRVYEKFTCVDKIKPK